MASSLHGSHGSGAPFPPAISSQVGFTLGVLRGNGLRGGLAVWLGFTMPSAIILFAFALGAAAFSGPAAEGLLHGLKLVAVAVIAQAIWGMARGLTLDRQRAGIALIAVAIVALVSGSFGQIGAIVFGAGAGLWLCRAEAVAALPGHLRFPVSRRAGALALALFAALFVIPSLLWTATGHQAIALFDTFYRSGALVFGGGHVVLPLLQAEMVAPGWATTEPFLAGYGVAQAVPGPLFTCAAYLGCHGPNGVAGASIALIAIFLPGLLLVYGMLAVARRLLRRGLRGFRRGDGYRDQAPLPTDDLEGEIELDLLRPGLKVACQAQQSILIECGRRGELRRQKCCAVEIEIAAAQVGKILAEICGRIFCLEARGSQIAQDRVVA